jgi:hypothetical protein
MTECWAFVFNLKDGQHVFTKEVTPEDVQAVTRAVSEMVAAKEPLRIAGELVIFPSEFLNFSAMRFHDFLKLVYFNTKSVLN